MKYRVIFSDNATLSDVSVDLNNYNSGSAVLPIVAADDYLFIGSRFPFNSLFVKVASANAETSAMSIDYWDGTQWRDVVETIDETASGGATLAQDGFITFVPSKQHGWHREDTVKSDDSTEEVTGLGGVVIYDHYWIRVSFSANLTNTTELSWVGIKFNTDDDLYSEYPVFNSSSLKSAIEAGKTTYEEQAVRAAEVIIDDLVGQNIIDSGNQLLELYKIKTLGVSKTAEVIFAAMGDDYKDDKEQALKEYKSRLKKGIYSVDVNDNAMLDNQEKTIRVNRLFR